jgi:hypothetical protein
MSVLLTGPTMSDLNQKILPSLRMNHLRREEGRRRSAGSGVLSAGGGPPLAAGPDPQAAGRAAQRPLQLTFAATSS